MDVRLFKFLVFAGAEALLGAATYLEWRFFGDTRVGNLTYHATFMAFLTIPILLLLPEDNWIWLLEEDLRSRKITLRSKAVKHMHLSMLYLMAIGYPIFIICMSLFLWSQWDKYRLFPPMWVMGSYALIYGLYCSSKNFSNVKKYDSLFAVGWDRKSAFIEIFVGIKVARNMKFFYKGFSLVAGIIFFIGAVAATPIYYKFFNRYTGYDTEQFIIMQTTYCVLFSVSIWIVAMYTSFQIFFTHRLEAWVRDKKSHGGDSK